MNEEIKALGLALFSGQVLQSKTANCGWVDLNDEAALAWITFGLGRDSLTEVRIKPATIMINNIEVPAPERVAPEYGETFYTPYPSDQSGFIGYDYRNEPWCRNLLNRSQIWPKEEHIKEAVKAMGWTE